MPTDPTTHLLSAFESPDYQPPLLPSVATELLELSGWAEVDFEKVIALLEKDPLLAGRVLQIAQSPLYPSKSKILSLKHAVVRMGLRSLVDVFFEATLKLKIFKAPGYEWPMAELQRHSTATAYVTRLVCRYAKVDGEHAFLCGLLHDVGIAASLITLAEKRKGPDLPDLGRVWPAIFAAHEKASEILAARWKLPVEIQRVLGHHHDPSVDGQVDPVAAAVCVAECVSSHLGAGIGNETEASTPVVAQSAIGLGDAELRLLIVEARDLIAQIG
ncbi:MAG: HDOD domain-containing protein [Deltaproteobacteria bacterium]|nr:HDOD domain-containing protein [Deltaproteobacteria bacterium]